MADFKVLREAVAKQLDKMSKQSLFTVDVDKEILWNTYLDSFPEGTNEIYRKRREYDCQCCRQFIKGIGRAVSLDKNHKLVSIWDVDVPEPFKTVVKAMSKLVKSQTISNIYLYRQADVGVALTRTISCEGEYEEWSHFYYRLSNQYVEQGERLGRRLGDMRETKNVFKRGVSEITLAAVDTVLELISQNSIYRGQEYKKQVTEFRKEMEMFRTIPLEAKDNFCWLRSTKVGYSARFRNTVIGTLLVDLSGGESLDTAVGKFESKVAPENYKRPTALITKSMIESAKKKCHVLGIEDALPRRYAVTEDLTINNVLFADRSAKADMQGDIFDQLSDEAPVVNMHAFKKIEEVHVDKFLSDVLPTAETVELSLDNIHAGNFVSLIAPVNADAKPILKWGNNFSWTYTGEVTDSMKERVKAAGGDVTGIIRCSLEWYNRRDLDIHVIEPRGNKIYFRKMRNHSTSGKLDVDNTSGPRGSHPAVENITWTDKSKMQEGVYTLIIHNYGGANSDTPEFDVELEHAGVIHSWNYTRSLKGDERVQIAKFKYDKETGIEFIEQLPSTASSKDIWGVPTMKFNRVKMVMNSPNHWDGEETGNRHLFFMLENCVNPDDARGLYNEFLLPSLTEHRKVFEVLGSKMRVKHTEDQLSGVGFSSTQRNEVICKVTGSSSRVIRILF